MRDELVRAKFWEEDAFSSVHESEINNQRLKSSAFPFTTRICTFPPFYPRVI